MSLLRKLFQKMKDGTARQILRELGWIAGYAFRCRGALIFYTLLGLVGIAMSLTAGVVTKNIIDSVTGGDSSVLIPAGAAYVALQLLRILCSSLTARISVDIRVRVEHQIRSDVYDRIMDTDWEALSAFHSGDILNRVDNDVSAVTDGVLSWVPDLITRLVQFIGIFRLLFYYDPTLALLALASAPVTVSVSGVLMKRLRSHNQKMRAISSQVMAFHEESFQNIQSIKSFGLTTAYGLRLRQVQEQYRDARMSYTRFQVGTSAIMSLTGMVVAMACFGWSVYRLWHKHITYGTMTLFLQLSGALSSTFSALVHMIPAMISGATAAGRIMALTELPREQRLDDAAAEAFHAKNPDKGVSVVARGLSYGYAGGETVLENVEFQANAGETVALIGSSGEGKTTMLRLLLGIVRPKTGSLYVTDGTDRVDISASTRLLFAYVPQNSTMFSGTVGENLRLMNPEATDEQLWHALELSCAADFVRQLPKGLSSPVLEQGGGFSQGQIQRLMLARAFLAKVPVLLLDEATSALDGETEAKVLQNIARELKGRTCIVTTHRMGVLSICHRVYRISGHGMEAVTADAEKLGASIYEQEPGGHEAPEGGQIWRK